MTLDSKESEALVKLAEEKKLIIMTGHIFLYSPEIVKLKEIINSDDFGNVRYIYTQRLNLGKIQDCGVIMDLAPHDISIIDYLLDDTCEGVKTVADSHILEDVEDVAFIAMRYKSGPLVHLHLSWLDPLKVRNTIVVGTKQMVVCDSGSKKINIYNNSVDMEKRSEISNRSYADHLLNYKYGDVVCPYIHNAEPMSLEAEEFINCMENNKVPIASGELGCDVVKTVNAMRESITAGGWVEVG
jgi:predicted dehydrogenase